MSKFKVTKLDGGINFVEFDNGCQIHYAKNGETFHVPRGHLVELIDNSKRMSVYISYPPKETVKDALKDYFLSVGPLILVFALGFLALHFKLI